MSRYSISGNEIVIRFTANPSTEIRTLIRNAGFKCVKNADDDVWEWRAERTQENERVAKEAVLISNGKKVIDQRAPIKAPINRTFKNVPSSDGEGLIKEFTLSDIIPLPVSPEVKEKTIINTVRKFNYTLQNSIVKRKQIELICDLYMGDLAKNCIVDYLRKHCVNGLHIIDYDEVRTDNFTEHDPWDFCINRNDLRVEVKSSTPPKKKNGEMESDEELLRGYGTLKGRDIKIIAKKTPNQKEVQPEEFDCFVFPQVYFRCRVPDARDFTSAELNRLQVSPMALQEIVDLQRFDNPLFFGWATKTDIIFFRDRLVEPQWEYGNAIYWKCPLRFSRTLNELVDFANKTTVR